MKQKLLKRANQKFATNQNNETTFINQTCRLLRSFKRKGGSARYSFSVLLNSAHEIEKSWVNHPQTTPGLSARPSGCKIQTVHPDTILRIHTMLPILGSWSFRPHCWLQLPPTHGISAKNLDNTKYPLDHSAPSSNNILGAHRNPNETNRRRVSPRRQSNVIPGADPDSEGKSDLPPSPRAPVTPEPRSPQTSGDSVTLPSASLLTLGTAVDPNETPIAPTGVRIAPASTVGSDTGSAPPVLGPDDDNNTAPRAPSVMPMTHP